MTVLDIAFVEDFLSLKAEMAFEDVLVHMMEPVFQSGLLQDERCGREAEDHDVQVSLTEEMSH